MKLALLIAAFAFTAAAQTAEADFPKSGFSIKPLDTAPGTTPAQLVATFLLPADEGFAPNVNVMTLANHQSLDGFIAITRKEFAGMKAKILSERQPAENTWVVESTATQGDKKMHFYTRAEFKNGRVYLATATALEAHWIKVSAQLKACVDSLRAK